MGNAKQIVVKPISSALANETIRRLHYSGRNVPNSQLHIGVYWFGSLEGVIQLGPPMVRAHVLPIVSRSTSSSMLEVNRMAFSEKLPRNSESRALGILCRMLRSRRPQLEWLLSYSDATQCGDGTIYRAAGFVLTAIKKNTSMFRLPNGEVRVDISLRTGMAGRQELLRKFGIRDCGQSRNQILADIGAKRLVGFQMRYIYFLNPLAKARLTCPILPFSAIEKASAGMARGQKRATSIGADAPGHQLGEGGSQPTVALQSKEPA